MPATAERSTKAIHVPFEVKADSLDEEARTFTGLASTWDLDLGGDVIHKGAFKKTLKEWKRGKKVLPLLDSHQAYGSVRAVVGKMTEAEETDDGLEATFAVIDGPDGEEIWRRLKGGYVDGLSIGYRSIREERPTEEERLKGVWRHLKEVELLEVSVVVWPMNPGARVDTDSVKSLAAQVEALEALGELSAEQKAELTDLHERIARKLAEQSDDEEPQEPKTWAPDDPARVELEQRALAHRLRTHPGTRADNARAAEA